MDEAGSVGTGGPGAGVAAPSPTISVCVCTFRRPALLGRLLDALAGQRLTPPFEVVVVDNDRLRSAGPALEAARLGHPRLVLRDALVAEQNIALARNRAVAMARGQLVAFIDDDERPVARWLGTLHRALERFGADGVFGPVLPELPEGAPRWIARGRFFDRPRHPSGVRVPATELRTGNALVRRALLSPRGRDGRSDDDGPFDPRWGLSGGEDSALLVELRARGARFVWCDDALVHEHIPEERARLGYLLRRAFAGGCGFARFRLEREGLRTAPSLLLRGALGVLTSSLLVPLALPLGRHRAVAAGRIGVGGAGKLAGLAGLRFEAYRVRTAAQGMVRPADGRRDARDSMTG